MISGCPKPRNEALKPMSFVKLMQLSHMSSTRPCNQSSTLVRDGILSHDRALTLMLTLNPPPNRDYSRVYRDHGEENGNYYSIMVYFVGILMRILIIWHSDIEAYWPPNAPEWLWTAYNSTR